MYICFKFYNCFLSAGQKQTSNTLFLNNAWFTPCRNINDQNNKYSVHAFHEVSFTSVSVCKIIGHNFSQKNIQTKMLN